MKEREKIYILNILSYIKDNSKKKIKLPPISEWNKDICEAINKLPFDKKCECSHLDYTEELNEKNDDFKNLKRIDEKYKVEKIYIYKELPDGIDFVRFAGTVILRENIEEYVKKCVSSIVEHLGIVRAFDHIKKELLDKTDYIKNYSDVKKDLELISKICAVAAKFSPHNLPISGSDNNIWNELLQNANDHILENGSMYIKISSEKLILEYPDKGFSIRDFIAISTNGNSGNVLEAGREGRKGTGFKSVYNWFGEVIIESGVVRCRLKDGECINLNIKNDDIILPKYEEINEWEAPDKKNYYPIPLFEEIKEPKDTTRIELKFKDNGNDKSFLKNAFVEVKGEIKDYETSFVASKVFLFLDNIKTFEFEVNDERFSFDRENYISDNYYREEMEFEVSSELKENNSYWNREERKRDLEDKSKITLLFPKDDNEIAEHKCLYSTLPIEKTKEEFPFYINLPLLELEESRKDLKDETTGWNEGILNLALCGDKSCFLEIFDKDGGKITKEERYKYFPYSFLGNKKVKEVSWKDSLEKIEFIRTTMDGKEFKYYSLSKRAKLEDIDKNEDVFVFLPDYMYWWFGANDSNLGDFECDVPFVYYGGISNSSNGETTGIHAYIKEKIKNKDIEYGEDNEECIISEIGRQKEGEVGKVLIKIRDYILKYGEIKRDEKKKDNFYILLKKIKEYEPKQHTFKHLLVFVFIAYLKLVFDTKKKYHCIVNRQFVTEKKRGNIREYYDIIDIIEQLKHDLYEEKGKWNEKEIDSLRLSISEVFEKNFIESPYIEYIYNYPTSGDNRYIVESKNLRENLIENILDELSEEEKYELSKEVFEEKFDNGESRIKYWISEGKLYGKNSKSKVCQLTENSYYGKIEDDNVYNDEIYRGYLKDLEEEIRKPEFYKESDPKLIESVVNVYKERCEEAIKEAIIDCGSERKELLLKLIIEKNWLPLDWNKNYSEIIGDFDNELKKEIFRFKEEDIASLPRNIKNEFDVKVSSEDKKKEHEKFSSMTLEDIVKENIYVLKGCAVGKKKIYCFGKLEEKKIIVLFGENAFGKMLKDVFECDNFLSSKAYADMTFNSNDGFWGRIEKDKDLDTRDYDFVYEKVKKIWERHESSKEDELLLNPLLSSFEVKGINGWIRAKGYGTNEKRYRDKICPVCKSILIAERSVLKLGYVKFRKDKDNISLPILLCKNCYESYKYAKDIYVELDIENYKEKLRLNNTGECKVKIVFDMYVHNKKEMEVNISFLNRYLWDIIIEQNI